MQPYKNLGGNSGIRAYEIGDGSITVLFSDGSRYLYDNISTGAQHIREMIRLALAGHGLNSYISRRVRSNFARKL